MPSLVIPPIIGGLGQTNLTAAALPGTTITASGTVHTKGSYSTLIGTTTATSYGIYVDVKGPGSAAANSSMLLDIAYGDAPSGGNEEILVANLDVGAATSASGALGKTYYFPVYIPSGVSIRMRCQAVVSADTCVVKAYLAQDPSYRWACGAVTTYGADTATSSGTSVTPGSGSFGTWTQIGAGTDPVRAHRFWHVGYSIGTDTTVVSTDPLVEIGTGPDSSNVTTIGRWSFNQSSAENVSGPVGSLPIYAPVVAGGELWARIASGEAEARRIVIYGMD